MKIKIILIAVILLLLFVSTGTVPQEPVKTVQDTTKQVDREVITKTKISYQNVEIKQQKTKLDSILEQKKNK